MTFRISSVSSSIVVTDRPGPTAVVLTAILAAFATGCGDGGKDVAPDASSETQVGYRGEPQSDGDAQSTAAADPDSASAVAETGEVLQGTSAETDGAGAAGAATDQRRDAAGTSSDAGSSGSDAQRNADDSANSPAEADPSAEPGDSPDAGTSAEADGSADAGATGSGSPARTSPASTASTPTDDESPGDRETAQARERPEPTKLPGDLLKESDLTPLNPKGSVLLDLPGKRVLLKAKVCLKQGLLEMLLCPKQTKEHESILSIDAKAYTIHTGLLAVGCTEGQAAKYDPDTGVFTPPKGQIVDVFIHWTDSEGNLHRKPAQRWIRRSRQRYYEAEFEKLPENLELKPDGNLRYDEMNKVIFWYGPMSEAERDACLKMSDDPKFQRAIRRFYKESQPRQMETDWIFVGSGFYEDGDSGRQYLAEGGYLICVANFAMAMMDVAVPSDSNGTDSLVFEAWTERIPPRDSEVLIELVPRTEGEEKQPVEEKPADEGTSGKEPAGAGDSGTEAAGNEAAGEPPQR